MPKTVFISYSHESDPHPARVLELSEALLRDGGLDVILDQYDPNPSIGWPLWMETNLDAADFVLLVCTPTYLRRVMRQEKAGVGLGVQWEGNLIYNRLYKNISQGQKYLPVLLDGADANNIPTPVQGHTFYRLSQFNLADPQYNALYRHMTAQPLVVKKPVGAITPLGPKNP